ncbi:MAG TPA: hypothetical protein VFB58_00835 [Chloroflexota bacterium]|nr:hypothetical protein [Chloroflexota bacterium]
MLPFQDSFRYHVTRDLPLLHGSLRARREANPAALRRLFTAEVNPELKTVAALASALDAELQIVPRKRREATKKDVSGVA